jgi:methanogenic corrinoid protein MtbC1
VNEDETRFVEAIADMREDEAYELAKSLLDQGVPAMHVLDLCRDAMDIVGHRFETGECFLPELVLAGEMLDSIGAMVKPLIEAGSGDGAGPKKLGRVLIGTVHGDLHDIGKNIVTFMLDINGFEVKDIGIDVPVERFVEEVREFQPQVAGLSGFLTLAFDSMKETIGAFEAAGLRDGMKIMIGGGQVDQTVCNYTGADDWGSTAIDAVNMCKKWILSATPA